MKEFVNKRYSSFLVSVILLIIIIGSGFHLNLSLQQFINGIPNILNFLGNMFPPDLKILPDLFQPTLITIETAIWGTIIGIFFSAFIALGAARNLLGKNSLVYLVCRFVLTVLRALPDLIWALIFVSAVGLGPFPGVLALAVFSIGELGKLFAEAIENIHPGPREALESIGVNIFKVIRFSILPQIMPEIISYSLFRLESNIRRAFILGMVGAGGLGFELNVAMRLFQYRKAAAIIILIIVTVMFIDFISSNIRKRII